VKRLIAFTIIVIALVLIVTLAWAQMEGFLLPRFTIASGDHLLSDDGRFSLDSAFGQAVTGTSNDGERFEVDSGFLAGVQPGPANWQIYLPLLVR